MDQSWKNMLLQVEWATSGDHTLDRLCSSISDFQSDFFPGRSSFNKETLIHMKLTLQLSYLFTFKGVPWHGISLKTTWTKSASKLVKKFCQRLSKSSGLICMNEVILKLKMSILSNGGCKLCSTLATTSLKPPTHSHWIRRFFLTLWIQVKLSMTWAKHACPWCTTMHLSKQANV